ncbi:MAG: class I SAM-dependent methyltransferase [Bradymonadales bacterium]|nr:class I SAM-dependent methyltransferase [Bradymonadales bacterium]
MSSRPDSYDILPYDSYAHDQSHPDTLAVIAALFGLKPAAVHSCRVLELGCSSGGNLLPMACNLPESRFLGVDTSARAIDDGQRIIEELGIDNLEIRRQSFAELSPEEGKFDYILCHGVFSWVDPATQLQILELCRNHLAPDGVACVSYNVYPGWYLAEMVRGMLRYYTASIEQPAERAALARYYLPALQMMAENEQDYRATFLRAEIERLANSSDSYLFHEYLVEHNRPLYFHQFVEMAESQGLRYLGDSVRETMFIEIQPEPIAQFLRQCPSLVVAQQHLDFFLNRRFRYSLLCLAEQQIDLFLKPETVQAMWMRSTFNPSPALLQAEQPSVTLTASETGLEVSIEGPLVRMALAVLAERAPAALSFDQLMEETSHRLQDPGNPLGQVEGSGESDDRSNLAAHLARLYFSRIIYFHSWPAEVCNRLSERPMASRLARIEAREKRTVTGQWHQHLYLHPIEASLVQRLDGSRDREALLRELEKVERSLGAGSEPQEGASTDELGEQLDRFLEKLRSSAVLIG